MVARRFWVFALSGTALAAGPANGRHAFLERAHEWQALHAEPEKPTNPFDSKTIEGPDCGNMKQIVGKWDKAKEVGKLAGKARGSISAADGIAGGLDATIAKVREDGKVIGEEGKPPAAIADAADQADEAIKAVTKAVTKLDTKLGTFKAAVGKGDMSGEKVTGEQIADLRDLTTALDVAAREAQSAGKALTKKAEEVHADALKSSDGRVKVIKNALASATPLLEESPDVAQKAGWAVDKAKEAVTAADKASGAVDPTKAGDQAPVVEAAKEKVTSQKGAVEEQHPKVTTAIDELKTATTSLKDAVKPLQEAKQTAAGGGNVANIGEDLTAAEKAEAGVKLALEKLRGAGKTLMKRKDRLEAAVSELEKTNSKYEEKDTEKKEEK